MRVKIIYGIDDVDLENKMNEFLSTEKMLIESIQYQTKMGLQGFWAFILYSLPIRYDFDS
jgi:hypothetical protein